jgi:hypothetical protein
LKLISLIWEKGYPWANVKGAGERKTMANIMELTKPTPEDEARRFCIHAGWHHNGDTSAMLGNGGVVQLPEVMVAFYQHLIAENEHLRTILEDPAVSADLGEELLARPIVVAPGASPGLERIAQEIAEKLVALHLIVWQGLEPAIKEYARETLAILSRSLEGRGGELDALRQRASGKEGRK